MTNLTMLFLKIRSLRYLKMLKNRCKKKENPSEKEDEEKDDCSPKNEYFNKKDNDMDDSVAGNVVENDNNVKIDMSGEMSSGSSFDEIDLAILKETIANAIKFVGVC
ncbi:conserved hypothetical protein [Ricinus communis]|uniref:Uncharacterized protein n=1 Tax=Ricinus communis TaxID=3988 RepID=B9SR71_RICCO|nr:conserved hypothetical protein [Ricinus communis]